VITYIALTLYPQRGSRGISDIPLFYQNDLAMRNIADVTDGKPIALRLQSISGGDAGNPLIAYYDIQGRKKCCYSFILSRTLHETVCILRVLSI
jgi:hypothetical protein